MAAVIRTLPFFLLALSMFAFPQEVVLAATNGLALWWKFVLPALLPFFILSELLMGAGFVHFLGILLEPLMRPLFRLPGKASFVVAMGFTSGIPIGAVLTSKLRQQNSLTQAEGERLLAFTSNPSPGFMFGAVASGMLGKPELGFVLVTSIYVSNLLVGILFRFYRSHSDEGHVKTTLSLHRAWEELLNAQNRDGRPLGTLLGDAVRQSIQTVLLVGGFITFFSVLLHMLSVTHVTTGLAHLLQALTLGHLSIPMIIAGIDALFETTLGCRTSIHAFTDLNLQVAVLSAVMAWGGLSVFAQVASFTSQTDLHFSAFFKGRVLQTLLAPIISQCFLHFSQIPASSPLFAAADFNSASGFILTWRLSVWVFCGIMLVFSGLACGVRLWAHK